MEVSRPLFEKLWDEVLRKYYEVELERIYTDLHNPPYPINQVVGNSSRGHEWPKSAPPDIKQKRQLRAFVRDIAYQKSLDLKEKGVIPGNFEFSASTYRSRYDELLQNSESYIKTSPEFVLALVRTLDFQSLDYYREAHGFGTDSVRDSTNRSDPDKTLSNVNPDHQTPHLLWIISTSTIVGMLLPVLFWFFIYQPSTSKGYIKREIADTNTLAKGVIGNWYSYNRTYEARGKYDDYVFNRIAWQIASNDDGYLVVKRHWKAMEFDGWTEFINGANSQLHFFINVYQNGSSYKDPVGYRHFNCGLWGENRDWLHADTLSCVCTTYIFSDSKIGEPLASREILVRQYNTSFESLKRGATSLTIKEVPWLEKFLPKNNSYIFQKPR